jgi:hypothetical protein
MPVPSNVLNSAADLYNTSFYEDDIFTGMKVIDMLSIGESILMFFHTTKQNKQRFFI